MKILSATLLIGILSSTCFGVYVSSKDTRCRSECRMNRITDCSHGYTCKGVIRQGCSRLVNECVISINHNYADSVNSGRIRRAETLNADPPLVKVTGTQNTERVFPSVDIVPGRQIVKSSKVDPVVYNAGLVEVITPLVVEQSSPVQGVEYTQEDVKVIKDENVDNTPIVNLPDGFITDNPNNPFDNRPFVELSTNAKEIALDLCIYNCIQTTCQQGTHCRSACKSFCLSEQSTIRVGQFVEKAIDKPLPTVDKHSKIKFNPLANDANVMSAIRSDLNGPIVKSIQSYPSSPGLNDKQDLNSVSAVEVDPITGQIVSSGTVYSTFDKSRGSLSTGQSEIDAKRQWEQGVIDSMLSVNLNNDVLFEPQALPNELRVKSHIGSSVITNLKPRDVIVKPNGAYASSVLKGEQINDKIVIKPMTGQTERRIGNTIDRQPDFFVGEKAIFNTMEDSGLMGAHINKRRSALVNTNGNLHQIDLVSPLKSKRHDSTTQNIQTGTHY